ncbi:MAG TPA: homocysteine S-methyltransferase family protein [Candidatus Aminicenantes bacterium]|nr:homocysteine S-methyltransferase family protein [Candidatus Aminicenantes bacterium]HRY65180.1 homocysteine S-methyltransferase family protein [Candidatus Aminicenantes bacterium]HRZ72352.1 homocysteine S-methyltransferase family protein [Candidatus Aminicenantes bacterium]
MNPAPSLLDLARTRTVLFDGAMGTELMARGLTPGAPPELWNVDRPEAVREVHAAYFEAGADVVSTNSFGATPLKLGAQGLEARAFELNLAAARLARQAAPPGRFVAGSLGPTGRFLPPQGQATEDELAAAYAEQARALAAGGVDIFLIETQYDLREALAAVRGIRSVSTLPVFAAMTFGAFRRGYFTLMGDEAGRSAAALADAGADVIGANCTLASEQMAGCVRALRAGTARPVIAQANAGQPVVRPDGTVGYPLTVEEYVRFVPEIVAAGAAFVGGCCGTTPAHIRAMARILRGEAGS